LGPCQPGCVSSARLGGTALATGGVARKLATILIVDVVGYSHLMGAGDEGSLILAATRRLAAEEAGYSGLIKAGEEGMLERLTAHLLELVDPKIKEHHGRILKTTGDGMFVEFARPVEAVRCAVEMQRAMIERNADTAAEKRLTFRVGIDLGNISTNRDVMHEFGRVLFRLFDEYVVRPHDRAQHSARVGTVARLEALAEPGGICISHAVRDLISDKLPYHFEDIGEQTLKDVTAPVRAYAMSADAVASTRDVPERPQPASAGRRISQRSAASGVPTMWLALPALVIAAVALSPFWAPQAARLLPWGEKSPASAQDYTALAARLTEIEKRPDPASFDVDAIKSAESTLARRVDQLEATLSRRRELSVAQQPPNPTLAPAPPAPSPRLPTEEIAQLMARGDGFLHTGDVASARLFYERAAGAGDGQAALRMGATFDPAFLDRAALRAARGDPAEARVWYHRARDLGEVEAERRLKSLGTRQGEEKP
jgi:class 3 adenylate cyclase